MAARPPDVERHTGMDFEAGHVHRARNVEEQPPGGMITGGERVTVPGASPDPGGAVSPARSTRASAGERSADPSPRDERAAARTANRRAEDDLAAILRKPWRGQAESVKGVQKKVLAQFEEKGLRKKKMEDGVQIDYAVTKYWVKYDGEDAAEETTRLNITRMFAKLLKSKHCLARRRRVRHRRGPPQAALPVTQNGCWAAHRMSTPQPFTAMAHTQARAEPTIWSSPVATAAAQRACHLGIRVRGERLHRGAEMVWGSAEGGESKVFKLASPS